MDRAKRSATGWRPTEPPTSLELKNFLQQFDQLQKLQLRIRWYSIHPRIEPKKARLRDSA